MKKYRIVEQADNEEGFIELILNEAEILHDYWPHWSSLMEKKYGKGHELITDENCIDDWIAVNWAAEVK